MVKKNLKRRSKNLGDAEIQQIVEILDGWSGKLTWDLLIDAIELRLCYRYTRQALHKHERIRQAFELKKKDLEDQKPNLRNGLSCKWHWIKWQGLKRKTAALRQRTLTCWSSLSAGRTMPIHVDWTRSF